MHLNLEYTATTLDTLIPGVALTEEAEKHKVKGVLTGAPALAAYCFAGIQTLGRNHKEIPPILDQVANLEHRLGAVPIETRVVGHRSKNDVQGFLHNLIIQTEGKIGMKRQPHWESEKTRIATTGNLSRSKHIIDFLCSAVPLTEPTSPILCTTLEVRVPAAHLYLPHNEPNAWLFVDSGVRLTHHYLHRLSLSAPRGTCKDPEEDTFSLFALQAMTRLSHSCCQIRKMWGLGKPETWHAFAATAQEIDHLAEEVG
ncbi:hypothetical protein JCM11251_005556 [Rhodosporidiobolus azoricus]